MEDGIDCYSSCFLERTNKETKNTHNDENETQKVMYIYVPDRDNRMSAFISDIVITDMVMTPDKEKINVLMENKKGSVYIFTKDSGGLYTFSK
jgi:hypothetical protein